MASKSNRKKVTDLTGKGLSKLDVSEGFLHSTTVILDDNKITDLDCLASLSTLEKLSVAQNHLDSLHPVANLSRLRVLNLMDNDITKIEGLSKLTHLEWLCLSGNNIKTIKNLNRNNMLRHLDLSSNSIAEFGDLSFMVHLKVLLLEDNNITGLKDVPSFLPPSLSTLSLADNKLSDLTEVQLLSYLPVLEELSLSGNPFIVEDQGKFVDYRPYVICCCKNLMKLDGKTIMQADKHNAKVLEAEGHLKMLQPGQHAQLAKDLIEAAPGYSPTFSRKQRGTDEKADRNSSGVDTSLLESESVYLPVFYDSPRITKSLSGADSRPYTAPALSEFKGIGWQELLAQNFDQMSPKSQDADDFFEVRRSDDILQPIPSESSPEHSFVVDESFSETDKKKKERQNQKRPKTAPEFAANDEKHKRVLSEKHQARLYTEEVTDRSSSAGSSDVASDTEDETQVQVDDDETQVQVDDVGNGKDNIAPSIQGADGHLLHTGTASVSLTTDEAMRVLHLAVAMIQACVRGFLQRKKYQRFLKRYKAATKIQALWRGYRTRFLDVKVVSLKNELNCRKLDDRINFLDAKINRVHSERLKDKMILGDIIKILTQEVNSQRDEMIEMREASNAESKYNDELHAVCIGLQNEICQLRGLLEHEFQPGAAYQPSSLGQDRAEAYYEGKPQTGTKVSESSNIFSGALGENHGTSPQVSKGPLHVAKSQERARAVSRQHKKQETNTGNDSTKLDGKYGHSSKDDEDGRNNPSEDSICSEKPGEYSSRQRKMHADSPSKRVSKTVDVKHNERSERTEPDKAERETESHVGKVERPSTVSLNETFDLSDSMDSSDEDTTVFQASECTTDAAVAIGRLGSVELDDHDSLQKMGNDDDTSVVVDAISPRDAKTSARKALGELLNLGDHESLLATKIADDASVAGGAISPRDAKTSARKAIGELLNLGDHESLLATKIADDASVAGDAISPRDAITCLSIAENILKDETESVAKRLEELQRRKAFNKEILGTLFNNSKKDKGEGSTTSNPVLHGDFVQHFEKALNSNVATGNAGVLSLERDAEVHSRQAIVDQDDGNYVDTEFYSADSTPADDKANLSATENYGGGLATTEGQNVKEDYDSIRDAIILENASTSESSNSAIAMINLAGAKYLSTEKNYVNTVRHQSCPKDARDLEGKDTYLGAKSLFKIENKTTAKRRSLFPSVTTSETPIISALQTVKYNTSFDSAISQGRFFSPLTVKGLTVGDTSSSLLEETEGADETTKDDAKTVVEVDVSEEDLAVDGKTHDKLHSGAQKADEYVDKDIRSIYKEVSNYHGSLFRGTSMRQRADQKHSPGVALSKNFDADIKAIIDRSRVTSATKSYDSGTVTASSLFAANIAVKPEDVKIVSDASSSFAQSSRDVDTASKGADASAKASSSSPAVAMKPSHARNRGDDEARLESTAVVENTEDEDKEVCVTSDAETMAEDIAEITLSDTIVTVEDAITPRVRTSTPVKQKPTPEAHRASNGQKSEKNVPKKDSSPSKGLRQMPSCLQSMPQIVPVVQKAKEKSPVMPMFEDLDSEDDSFTG